MRIAWHYKPAGEYILVNCLLAGVIACVFIYSGFFSANRQNHPVPSVYYFITGKKSASTGLSRSFSEMVRGRFQSARQQNPYGAGIFFFFLGQFTARVFFTGILLARPSSVKTLLKIDIPFSIAGFLFCFYPFIIFFIKTVFPELAG